MGVAVVIAIIALGLLLFQPKQSPTKTPTHASGAITTLKNATGTDEINTFLLSDNVYAKGSGMHKNQQYKIYIIVDTTITEGMAIPTNVTTTVTVTTDGNGAFGPILVWSNPLTTGYYDIIADCQNVGVQGYYDSPDAIDDIEVNATAGFFVIPEIPLGTIAVLSAGLTATLLKRKRIF